MLAPMAQVARPLELLAINATEPESAMPRSWLTPLAVAAHPLNVPSTFTLHWEVAPEDDEMYAYSSSTAMPNVYPKLLIVVAQLDNVPSTELMTQ